MNQQGAPQCPPALTRSPVVRAARRLSRSLLLLYAVWCLACFVLQGRLIYPRHIAGGALPQALIPAGVEQQWLDRPGGARVEAWLVRPARPPRALVVFLHGNAELIDHCLEDAHLWTSRGCAVLLPEYRGYGRSTGSPSQAPIVGDILAHINAALADLGPLPIILHGRSLGSAFAVQAAASLPTPPTTPAALVLESPFTSVLAFSRRMLLPDVICRSPLRTDRLIGAFDCPVLILHTHDDEIVPFAHGERLARLNPRATLVTLQGGHNTRHAHTAPYQNALRDLAHAALGEP